MTREQFQARIAELTARGYTSRAAERVAKKERRLRSPRHKAAVTRKLEAATLRYEATGNAAALRVLEVK